jgi:hypothetical protein
MCMPDSQIAWTQDVVAKVPLQRFVGRVGEVEVGTVEYDGAHKLWTWWSPFSEEAWGHAREESGAKQGFEVWLRRWLENFRPFFEE